MKIDHNKRREKDILRESRREEKGGIIERMDKKAQASVFHISSTEIANSIESFIAQGGKITRY
jgi:hypothetical protein